MTSPGALALVGSGEYLPAMLELESALLAVAVARGKSKTFVQIPTAAGRESADSLAYWKRLGAEQAERLGVQSVFLPIFNRVDAFNVEYTALIENAGLIYLSGGDPTYLAKTLHDSPVGQAIERNWRAGSSLAGCSAGAMAMGSNVPQFLRRNSEDSVGLSIVPNIRTFPHFDKFFGWAPEGAIKLLANVQKSIYVIGIDELTALVTGLDDVATIENHMWQVHGVGSVHVLRGAPAQKYSHGALINLPDKVQ